MEISRHYFTDADHISCTDQQPTLTQSLTGIHQITIDTDLLWLLIIKHVTCQLQWIDTKLPHYASTKLL